MLYFQEMQRRVERSLGRARRNGPVSNPGDFRKRARKTEKEKLTRIFKEMSESEKRRALVMKSLRNAIDERPGTYIDHVMVTRNWARKTSNDFEFFRLSLRDSTTKRLFLSVKDDSIIPIGMKPIGFRDREEYRGLSILEDETKKELGEIIDGSRDYLSDRGTIVESQEFTSNPQRRFSCRKDKDHSEIRKLYRELLSSMSPYQAVEELPLITGEKRADIEAKPAKIVGSTRRLIPYILLAEEADRDFKKIKSVTWFKAPKNPTDFEFWEGEDILEDLGREDVIEILSEEGDAWILEIFDLVRGIDAAGKWGRSEILDLQEAIIKNAPTEGLRRMSEAILIGKTSS